METKIRENIFEITLIYKQLVDAGDLPKIGEIDSRIVFEVIMNISEDFEKKFFDIEWDCDENHDYYIDIYEYSKMELLNSLKKVED